MGCGFRRDSSRASRSQVPSNEISNMSSWLVTPVRDCSSSSNESNSEEEDEDEERILFFFSLDLDLDLGFSNLCYFYYYCGFSVENAI